MFCNKYKHLVQKTLLNKHKNRITVSEFKLYNLKYSAFLFEYYQKLCHLPGFVLLESTDKARGRYDILSAYPYDVLTIDKQKSCTNSVLSKLQEKIIPYHSSLDLPFQGGAIGFFSYDLACHIADIIIKPQPGLMTMPMMQVGLYDWAIIVDHFLKKITVFSANTQTNTEKVVEDVLLRWQSPSTSKHDFILETIFSPLISKSAYQEAFYAIHADLTQGRCYQVNYTQPFNAHFTGDSWAIYKQIKASNPVPYSAFIRSEDADILCFSPERFIQMDNGHLLTSPIKGTARRVLNSEQDNAVAKELQACPKNRAENVMIVDLMRNDFGKIAKPGSVKVEALCELERYKAVHHLVSHVTAECQDKFSLVDAFLSCFPGGSITGAPKLESMRVISEQEEYARGVYCGSIGYFSNHGRFDTNIAIRTITASNNMLYLAAGGALIIDSKCEEEYLECFTKIAGILKGLYTHSRG